MEGKTPGMVCGYKVCEVGYRRGEMQKEEGQNGGHRRPSLMPPRVHRAHGLGFVRLDAVVEFVEHDVCPEVACVKKEIPKSSAACARSLEKMRGRGGYAPPGSGSPCIRSFWWDSWPLRILPHSLRRKSECGAGRTSPSASVVGRTSERTAWSSWYTRLCENEGGGGETVELAVRVLILSCKTQKNKGGQRPSRRGEERERGGRTMK